MGRVGEGAALMAPPATTALPFPQCRKPESAEARREGSGVLSTTVWALRSEVCLRALWPALLFHEIPTFIRVGVTHAPRSRQYDDARTRTQGHTTVAAEASHRPDSRIVRTMMRECMQRHRNGQPHSVAVSL